ncbi:HTH-type transcriptional regulator/antitoxin HipB [Nocardioides salarius]|uniref:HTH-type transcriptional regulator/antitoxin HipB n=1 Tax=Nocardioides salarius TaxID=374513 RepID=A0ABS2M932_9ACTN|nr:helix-turn-helix transcriptional regulator [Nocardioides salarius]MBM7507686.1 HTH-type transcriptional regulator/antitoxin HipB [Nocardioides salarius]
MDQHVRWAYDVRDLGEALRRARTDQGLTQIELAERLGVTRMTLSRLENGESVSAETAMRALSECGYALVVAPKFATLHVEAAPTNEPDQDGGTGG